MKRPLEVLAEENDMQTIVGLTSAFESISSMKIKMTKRGVLGTNSFFDDIWSIYKNIRVSGIFQFGRQPGEHPIDKELFILITSSAGLSGDIDERLIRLVRKYYDQKKNDIVVIGKHGAQQLTQAGISYQKFFNLPKNDPINVEPLMNIVKQYRETRVFYQSYVSLTTQEIRTMRLTDVIEAREAAIDDSKNQITEATYIFEPNTLVVVAHMETSMLRLALLRFIYDSRLAQHASRFRAMSAARERAVDEAGALRVQYNQARRGMIDQRLKEVTAGLKKMRIQNEQ